MSQKKKNEILSAALALFSKKGYLKTSLADIAEEVGITKGGIYHYIDRKEDLLFLIHKEMVDAFLVNFQEFSTSGNDPWSRLLGWIHVHMMLMQDYRSHIRVFFNELYNLEIQADFERIVKTRDEIFQMLYDIIKDGMKTRQFRSDINPKILTFLIFGMLNWFYQWYRPGGPRSLENIYDDVIRLVSHGILKKEPTDAA